ncbi:MAG: hypothetical protein PCFJNLEI_02028 [Verrucomicrobiae bacterium]|nr:hypothetical protein [Verrucomicrobiae bacterium]
MTGAGDLRVAGGNGTVNVLAGGTLAPGSGIGTLSISGTNLWSGGGRYQWQISDFTGGSGGGTDLVTATYFNIGSSAGDEFVLEIASLTPGNASGSAANFDKDGTYLLTVAEASSSVLNFSADKFSLNLAGFSNAWDGVWTVVQAGNLVQLNYEGATNLVWDNVQGNFSNLTGTAGIHWQGDVPPPLSTTNVVLYFGGVGSQQYTATNNLSDVVTKRLVLTNNSTATQAIVGNGLVVGGVAPEILQNGSGAFVLSNDLVLAANTLVGGTGTGTLELSGALSGNRSLTKTGAYNLVMGGANSYSGSTVLNGGTLTVRNDSALAGSSQTVVNALGTLVADGGAPVVRRLAGSGSVVVSNSAALIVSNQTLGSSFAGVVSGDGSLTKAGNSTLTLSGVNSYRGDTRVAGGTLTVTGYLASTNLLVNSGATFNWSAVQAVSNLVAVTVAGTVNFNNSGTLASLSGSGSANFQATTSVGNADTSSTFAGRLGGDGTLSKIGAGVFTATGANSLVGNLVVNAGTVEVAGGGSVTVTNLFVQAGSGVALNSGTLAVRGVAAVSNGLDFVVGNGSSVAALQVTGVAHLERDLIVTNNGTLKGSGTIVVAGGGGKVFVQSGGVQAPGNSVGTQTVIGTNVWEEGGSYQWEINDFAGNVGSNPGWDWLNVVGVLSNAATSGNPFVIDITSLAGATPGLAANFDYNATYSNVIATATTVAGFDVNAFTLTTANFQNVYDGVFALSLQGGTNLVLSYTGVDAYVWTDVTGNFSGNGNWRDGAAPPVNATNVVLYFGGSTASGYTANNDLTGLVSKQLILTNLTTTIQTITGNSLTLAGVAPELTQNGSGAFVISNNLVLAANTQLAGSGSGTVTLAGALSGAGTLTKTGSWTVVLAGANTYSGLTVVRAGALFVANGNALAGSTLSNLVAGAVVFSNVGTANVGGLAGAVDLGLTNTAGSGVGLRVGQNNAPTRYDGELSGAGSLTKLGSGTLTLGGVSTYSGGTVVNAGTLVAGVLANGIGGAGSSLGSGSLTLNGGTLRFGLGSLLRVTNTVVGSVTFNGGTLNAAELVNQGQLTSVGGVSTVTSDLFNDGVVSNTAGTLRIGSGGSGVVSNSGTIVLAGGSLTASVVTNTGTVLGYGTLTARLANSSVVTATNGQLNLEGVVSGAGQYRVAELATLSFGAGGSISTSGLDNTNATIRLSGGVLTNDQSFLNAGTLALAGGTYYTGTRLTNNLGATIRGFGTISSADQVVNNGTIFVQGPTPLVFSGELINAGAVAGVGGRLEVTGVFTNSGSLAFVSSVGTFNSAVVNSGALSLNGASTSVFTSNLLVSSSGYLLGNGTYVFEGDLNNQSALPTAWNTLNTVAGTNTVGSGTTFLFSGSGLSSTQYFTHAGLQLSGGFVGSPVPTTNGVQDVSNMAAVAGFQNNFAVGQLWLTNTTVMLSSTGGSGALFVNDLYLLGGSRLVISDNTRVYFVNSNSWDLANITLLGNAQIHQLNSLTETLSVIPEPNVLVLWLSGFLTFAAARRRSRRS